MSAYKDDLAAAQAASAAFARDLAEERRRREQAETGLTCISWCGALSRTRAFYSFLFLLFACLGLAQLGAGAFLFGVLSGLPDKLLLLLPLRLFAVSVGVFLGGSVVFVVIGVVEHLEFEERVGKRAAKR